MAQTTPNKEIVRRLCLLHGVSECYILSEEDQHHVDVLADIIDNKLDGFNKELEAWAGMSFHVFNKGSKTEKVEKIIKTGVKILPVNL